MPCRRPTRLHRDVANMPGRVEPQRHPLPGSSCARRRTVRACRAAGGARGRSRDQPTFLELEHDRFAQGPWPMKSRSPSMIAIPLVVPSTGAACLDVGRGHVAPGSSTDPVQDTARAVHDQAGEMSARRRRQRERERADVQRSPTASAPLRRSSKSTSSDPPGRKVSRRAPGIARYRDPAAVETAPRFDSGTATSTRWWRTVTNGVGGGDLNLLPRELRQRNLHDGGRAVALVERSRRPATTSAAERWSTSGRPLAGPGPPGSGRHVADGRWVDQIHGAR